MTIRLDLAVFLFVAVTAGCGDTPRQLDAGGGDSGVEAPSEQGVAVHLLPACGCLLGEGPYCGARAAAAAADAGCLLPLAEDNRNNLLKCEGDSWSVLQTCHQSCAFSAESAELDDECLLPECDCFVKVAWCGSGAAKVAQSRGCRIPLLPQHNGSILYCPGGKWSVKQACDDGCVEAPTGTPDFCKGESDYLAPFSCGATFSCSSGNHTSNHSGKDEYAYDFALPMGTTLRASRGGKVLRTRLVSPPGSACYNGGGSGCANFANTVEILHDDGTVGLYMHLSAISVSQGKVVSQGDVIGKSGNSGWSTGPHLHIQVQQNCGIWWCQSQPFRFGEKASVTTGTSLTSQNCS